VVVVVVDVLAAFDFLDARLRFAGVVTLLLGDGDLFFFFDDFCESIIFG
jgi:hypothetical protein